MKFLIHIPVAVILIFLAAVACTVYLVSQTPIVHHGVNLLLAKYIETKYHVKVDFGEISGSLLENITVNDVRIDFEAAPQNYRLAKIKQVGVYYNINNLWNRVWRLDSLTLIEPVVILRSDSTGKLLVPSLEGEKTSKQSSRRSVAIDHVRLTQGRFQWFKYPSVYYVDSINVLGAGSMYDSVLTVSIDSLALTSPRQSLRIRELHLDLSLVGGIIDLDSLYLVTDSSKLVGNGSYPLDKSIPYHFALANSHLSFAELSSVFGIRLIGGFDLTLQGQGSQDGISGNADLDGSLFGRRLGPLNTDFSYADGILRFDSLSGEAFDGIIEGSVELNLIARPETFAGSLQATGVNLDKVVPNTFPSRINGLLQINGSGLGANSFNLDLSADCGKGSFDFVNYDSLSGTISVNTEDMYFHPGFALRYKNSRFTAEGVVDYNGDMQLSGDFATTQLADFWGDLFIKELSGGGRGTYVVSGYNKDPDIRGAFEGDSCSFYGFATDSLKASFDIASFLYRRQGNVSTRAWNSDIWNLPADSVHAVIDIDSDHVVIDRTTLYHQRYTLDGKGTALIHDSTASVLVSDLVFQFDSLRYVNVGPVPIEFLADRIVVDSLRLKGNEGLVSLHCDYGYDSAIVLKAAAEDFHFSPWLKDLGYDSLLTGGLNLRGTMTGKLRSPAIAMAGRLDHLAYGSDSLGTVEADLRYLDSTLSINTLRLGFKGGNLAGSGQFPLYMNFDSGIVRVPQQPMRLTFNSSGNDLSVLSSVNEDLESLTGDYQLVIDIYGTPQQPQSRGSFDLKNGTLKVYQLENPIEDLTAEIKSDGKLVTVELVEGKVRYKGHEGTVRALGDIVIRSREVLDYDLGLVGFDVPIKYDLGDIYGRCDFDLAVKGFNPPRVTGDVTIREATYFDEFETPQVTAAIAAADTAALWDYVINALMLPASVTVKNADFNMVVDGDVTVIRQSGRENYQGALNIVRGNSYLFDLNFRIENGSSIVFDNIEAPNPALDIKVSTRVRNYAGDVSSSAYDQLDLVIGGTLTAPSISAAAGSPYSDNDIASVIIANKPPSSLGNDPLANSSFQNRLQIGATGYLAARTSQVLSRALGLEVFEIAPTYNQRNTLQGATVSLGLYTLPNIYTYVSSLSPDGKADYGVERRYGKHVFIGASLDRDNQWHLNLNLNWEFR
jgi:hypothetical protein